ncbi:MAG TPA: tetratricopeptide repeat protein [Puia sp.]|nr:tetratricopeptide repeat protein [Puia sp.]
MLDRKFILGILFFLFVCTSAIAQNENSQIRKGNRFYKQKQYDQSEKAYQKALTESPENPTAQYNLGNTEYRKNNLEDAVKSFDASGEHSPDTTMKLKSYYNKGVALIKQQKLDESIEAWKNALRLDPTDVESRENLEKALMEKRKQSQPKDQQNQKQDQKKQDQKDQQHKPQQSKLNKQQVDQLLKALAQKEKEVQDKMNQNKSKSLSQPDKDW